MGCLNLTYHQPDSPLKVVHSNFSNERKSCAGAYRYGFNGMEKESEFTNSTSHYDFGARIYDSRIGKFLSLDPLISSFPQNSPYLIANNNVIVLIDVNGMSGVWFFEVSQGAEIGIPMLGFARARSAGVAYDPDKGNVAFYTGETGFEEAFGFGDNGGLETTGEFNMGGDVNFGAAQIGWLDGGSVYNMAGESKIVSVDLVMIDVFVGDMGGNTSWAIGTGATEGLGIGLNAVQTTKMWVFNETDFSLMQDAYNELEDWADGYSLDDKEYSYYTMQTEDGGIELFFSLSGTAHFDDGTSDDEGLSVSTGVIFREREEGGTKITETDNVQK